MRRRSDEATEGLSGVSNLLPWLLAPQALPLGRGGDSVAGNVRLLCAAHNRFEAERAYGREHVERAIAERRADDGATRASADPVGPASRELELPGWMDEDEKQRS